MFYCLDSFSDDADVLEVLVRYQGSLTHVNNKGETLVKYLVDKESNKF